jgi:hypothetical protein
MDDCQVSRFIVPWWWSDGALWHREIGYSTLPSNTKLNRFWLYDQDKDEMYRMSWEVKMKK